jgi:hypothetical protein
VISRALTGIRRRLHSRPEATTLSSVCPRASASINWRKGGSGELRFLVADGGAPVERVTWRDQREDSGSVALEPEAAGFLGYYQRVNEGPIGYRGRAATDLRDSCSRRRQGCPDAEAYDRGRCPGRPDAGGLVPRGQPWCGGFEALRGVSGADVECAPDGVAPACRRVSELNYRAG